MAFSRVLLNQAATRETLEKNGRHYTLGGLAAVFYVLEFVCVMIFISVCLSGFFLNLLAVLAIFLAVKPPGLALCVLSFAV